MPKQVDFKFDKKTLAFCGVVFSLFAVFVYLFPYSGDDWAWGSIIGLERLESFFENYNGRYAGNLLVMALTRSKLLNIILTAFSMVCVCIFPVIYFGTQRLSSMIISLALLLLVPRSIRVQSVVWTAGFSNYVPPILLTVLYMIIVKNIFEEEKPVYGKVMPFAAAVIGFSASLFMENITLYGVVLSLGVLVFTAVKHKRVCITHIANFAGCLAGTALMFSNSAYGSIANEQDGYRTMANSGGLFFTIKSHIISFNSLFFTNNLILFITLTALCLLLARAALNDECKKEKAKYIRVTAIINITSLVFIAIKAAVGSRLLRFGKLWLYNAAEYFTFFAATVYFISVCIIVATCVKNKISRERILFALFSVPVMLAPLMLVTPIGPRCFFAPYFLCAAACIGIYGCVSETLKLKSEKAVSGVACAVSAVMAVYLLCVYVPIHACDVKRNEYAIKQSELGYKKITVCKLPYTEYVWTGDPSKAPWDERYKLFYGIDSKAEIELLPYEEFDSWAENFDKNVVKK